jgi:CBS domain-containing protein
VRNQRGVTVGRVADAIARWEDAPYPAVTGLVVHVGRQAVFVPIGNVDTVDADGVALRSAELDLRELELRPGEVSLGRHVLDHQLVDVDGVRVVRSSDLYLAVIGTELRLVGVDVGLHSLLRRLGPKRRRARPTPSRVLDWAAVQPFAGAGAVVLSRPNDRLRRLRPADLADLLEELARGPRRELLNSLDADIGADALEEMEADEAEAALRDLAPTRAAELVARMEPDEAVDALRDLDDDERAAVLAALPPAGASELARLLGFDRESAGGVMTTLLVTVHRDDPVSTVVARLATLEPARGEIDGVLVVDDDGRLVDDVSLFELLVHRSVGRVGDLVAEPYPVTVAADDDLADVIEAFVESRGTSVVVVDDDHRPIGRILADDLVDAMREQRGLARRSAR